MKASLGVFHARTAASEGRRATVSGREDGAIGVHGVVPVPMLVQMRTIQIGNASRGSSLRVDWTRMADRRGDFGVNSATFRC